MDIIQARDTDYSLTATSTKRNLVIKEGIFVGTENIILSE